MKIEEVHVFNFSNALRGMRNPKASWHKSDSKFGIYSSGRTHHEHFTEHILAPVVDTYKGTQMVDPKKMLIQNGILELESTAFEYAFIGYNDLKLAQSLAKLGSVHRKYLRQIFVTMDITAPLYLWKELDTYKVSTTANSTSTMHTLDKTSITLDCFETDDMPEDFFTTDEGVVIETYLLPALESLRNKYNETKDKKYWKELVRWLPEGFCQKRTITFNYETLAKMRQDRMGHKLSEWEPIVNVIENLPYAEFLICN